MAGDEDQPLKPADATAARGDGREEDQAARLPEDVLAAILLRVPPCSLAASRCVCRAWRDAVDGRGLLRADLLPLWLAGLFVHYDEHKFPEFFARPSSSSRASARAVSGDLSFLPSASPHCGHINDHDGLDWGDYEIEDHCNGLLLLSGNYVDNLPPRRNYVVNPATRWWHTLPPCPPERGAEGVEYHAHLVYDPMVSPYYDVVMIPTLEYRRRGDEVDPSTEESEWPPSRCRMHVFSSKSGHWEDKYFVREGDAAGSVRQMREGFQGFKAVYFRRALYVHRRHNNFLMRISLSNNTYRVIKPPMDARDGNHQVVRSEKGVYFVSLNNSWHENQCCRNKCWLQVWILNESCGKTEWMLKHDKDLKPLLARGFYTRRVQWILEDINYHMFASSSYPEENKKATCEESIEWNSDEDVEEEDMVDHCYLEEKKEYVVEKKLEQDFNDDNALYNRDTVEEYFLDGEYHEHFYSYIEILGFHPYKEIVFLSASEPSKRIGLAYHLNGTKIEELGNIYPKEYIYFKLLSNQREMITSFPYTPCWIEEFPGNS